MIYMCDLCVTCSLLIVISKCHCIGIDYYDENNIQSQTTDNDFFVNSEFRRKHNRYYLNNSSRQELNAGRYVKFNKTYGEKIQKVQESYISNDDGSYTKTFSPSTIEIGRSKIGHGNYNVAKLLADMRKEYEYIYEDDDKEPEALRHYVMTVEEDMKNDRSETTTKVPIVEFYNLEPAIQQLKIHYDSNHSEEYNVWYTSEDLPCWDLPLLYAEFGKRKETSDVFVMSGGELKNVIEKNYTTDSASERKTKRPLTYYTRKWCTVAPCYGDHTLCLFSDEILSSLCGSNYRVVVPNILEQIALVNTLNSMRNKIAEGESIRYRHLPTASNIKQILYDYDLEKIAKVWLHQCIPGPALCSALDGNFVTHLECTKYAKYCCIKSNTTQFTKCTPKPECSLLPTIGCLHVWFYKAGMKLTNTDVQCGHISVSTYATAQLLWADTYKIGCAYAYNSNGDVRVVCNFSPGAPFFIETKLFCGVIGQKDFNVILDTQNMSDSNMLLSHGIKFDPKVKRTSLTPLYKTESKDKDYVNSSKKNWGVDILTKLYNEGWIRKLLNDYKNGTKSMIARLVVKYEFIEQNGVRCDSDQSIYVKGPSGSLCLEKGRRYKGLCYDFRDPTPGYRLVAILAPIALFSLILYDLFSGVVRQTNY